MSNKNSKFIQLYSLIKEDENLRMELSQLRGKELESRLSELLPGSNLTNHALRKVRELLKENNILESEVAFESDDIKLPVNNTPDNTESLEDDIKISSVSISGTDETDETETVTITIDDAKKLTDQNNLLNELIKDNELLESQVTQLTNELSECKTQLCNIKKTAKKDLDGIFKTIKSFSSTSKATEVSEALYLATVNMLSDEKIIDLTELSKQGVDITRYCTDFALSYLFYNFKVIL